jgi:hypothetical protein
VKRRRKQGLAIGAATLCLVALGATVAWGAPRNGGFESGDFSRWQRNSLGAGNWQIYSGPGFQGLSPPPRGDFAAQTVQNNPSSNVLYRDLRLKRNVRYRLTMQVYYVNTVNRFFTPNSLRHTGASNQQYRIDLMKPNSPLRSLKPKHVLTNIFRTRVGDPLTMTPNPVSENLSRFAGRTVRLRFAEVDNEGPFAAGIDAVTLKRR